MEPVFCLLDAKSLAARHLVASATNLPTRRRVNRAPTSTVGDATIQLLSQAVIHRFKNPSTNPVVFKTETPETTQDIKMIGKNRTLVGCIWLGSILLNLLGCDGAELDQFITYL